MQVETFEVCEVDAKGKVVEIENAEEVAAFVEKLGLDAQKKFIGPDSEEGEKPALVPYRKMTHDEAFVYSNLCPERCKLERFGESLIPLRVLQVAAHAKGCGLFDELWVWHAANADVKDPVLVGIKGSEWNGERYILARWGEVLDSFESMKAQAVILWRNRTRMSLARIIAKAQQEIEALDSADPLIVKHLGDPSFTSYDRGW